MDKIVARFIFSGKGYGKGYPLTVPPYRTPFPLRGKGYPLPLKG